jgi:hypothetical protein
MAMKVLAKKTVDTRRFLTAYAAPQPAYTEIAWIAASYAVSS